MRWLDYLFSCTELDFIPLQVMMTDIAGHATHTHTQHTAHKALDNPNRFHPKIVFTGHTHWTTTQNTLMMIGFFFLLFLCNSKWENKKTETQRKKPNKQSLIFWSIRRSRSGLKMQTDLTSMKTVSHWQESTTTTRRRTRRVKWRRATPRLATLLHSRLRLTTAG